jgi:hypothetical protein
MERQGDLAHITFWHEHFARNAGFPAAGRKPAPLQGTLAALNQRSVEAMLDCTCGEGGAKPRSAADLLQ